MKRNYLVLGILFVTIFSFSSCTKEIKQGDFVFKDSPYDNRVTVIKYTGNNSIVDIPEKINGRDVREIASGAFKDLPNLIKVNMAGGNVDIRSGAFENCPKLYNFSVAFGSIYYPSSEPANAFINCPEMFKKTASSDGENASNSSSSQKSGVVGTYSRVSAKSTGGNTNSSTWKTVVDSRLGSGVSIPSKFIVNSNGTASAGNLFFTWSGSGSNITFIYSGGGNIKATYNASRGEIYMQLPTVYNGTLDLLAITYR